MGICLTPYYPYNLPNIQPPAVDSYVVALFNNGFYPRLVHSADLDQESVQASFMQVGYFT